MFRPDPETLDVRNAQVRGNVGEDLEDLREVP